jgi:predicted nucleic acid-binding protein
LAPQVQLRSLDAIHLAAAQTVGDDLRAIVTYDRRMADAAGALGLVVQTPA